MTAIGKIHSYPNNPRVAKALIAAKYNKLDIEVPGDFQMGVTNKTPEFMKKFPLGKIPVFEGSSGVNLFESNAIAYYVANYKSETKLLGKNKEEAALIQQYLAFADNEISPATATWLYPILGYMPYNKAAHEKAVNDTKRFMDVLNTILLRRTYLVGECITLADIVVACTLMGAYRMVYDAAFRKPYTNVNRWFTTCINQPEFKAVLGEVALCEKAQVYDPKKAEAQRPKAEEKKPAAAPKKEETADEAASKEEKAKNPLDLLPPSKFNLESWKRFYSNNETRPDAINYFWENYDPEGFSIWRVTYKYNDELTLTFMSSNLVGGFFQRLERARKYAFGSMMILGEDNNNQIDGFFVFRGQDVPAEVKDAADYESYNFVKVDPLKDAKTKTYFEQALAWDAPKFADGKVFK